MDDGVPKPGSILSLISNKNVKYVGTLFHIDMESSAPSLRLKNVKCYGTEGRGDPQDSRPPSDEILPDVLFRGTDIIFLEVQSYYNPPPPQPAYSQPQPAYSQPQAHYGAISQSGQAPQVSPQIAPSQNQYGVQEAPVWGSLPTEYSAPSGSQYVVPGQNSQHHVQPAAAAPRVVVTPAAPQRPTQAAPQRQAQAPQPAQPMQRGSQQQPSTAGKAVTPFETVQAAPQPARQASNQAAGPPGFSAAPPGIAAPQPVTLVTPAAGLITPAPGLITPAPGLLPPAAVTHLPLVTPQAAPQVQIAGPPGGAPPHINGPLNHRGRGRGRGHAGRGRGGGRAPPPSQGLPIPQEDFNFEEGIQKFDKDNIKDEADAPIEEADSGSLYNKDDFFDALSSDLTNKLSMGEQSTRPKFSEQRQIDMETFGGTGMARRGRGRGGRRGRGGGLNPYATGREHLEAPPQGALPPHQGRSGGRGRGEGRGPGPNGRGPPRGRGRGRGRYSESGQASIIVQ